MGKKDDRIEQLRSELIALQNQSDLRNIKQWDEFSAAMKAIGCNKPAVLCVDGHFIPLVIADLNITREAGGMTDYVITAYPQPPMLITGGRAR